MKERDAFMKKRGSHQVQHNVEMVIGSDDLLRDGDNKVSSNNVSPARWAGMNITSERGSAARFKRTKDLVSDWND